MELAELVYRVTASFPDTERYGLASQSRRAAISIASNIAEGCGRRSRRDFRRFIDIAYGSLTELETQILLSRRLGFVTAPEFASVRELSEQTGQLLNGLRRSLLPR